MTIDKKQEGSNLTIALKGRLDTTTSPQLESELHSVLDVLLSTQKTMNRQGSMTIRNANSDVMDVFEVTGFIDILNIEA